MRLGFVHEWLVSHAGSERVVAAAAECYPGSPIFTLVHNPAATRGTEFKKHPITTSWLQRLPGAAGGSKHRLYLPLMPMAVESLDVGGLDVVVSSSHAVAKGVLTRADQLHISYVHTPARYAWDLYHEHLREVVGRTHTGTEVPEPGRVGGLKGALAQGVMHYFRGWDFAAAQRVDVFVANSRYVARRIWKTYRREAAVIYPPVDVERFTPAERREDFYLVVSRLVPYKRVTAIAEAFTRLGRPLVIVGDGPETDAVRKASGPNVTLVGELDDAAVAERMARCRAFVIAADEDFGITAVEAMAAGAPVIAYGKGGVRETVVEGETGVFFAEQTADGVAEGVTKFEAFKSGLDAGVIRSRAERFSRARFQREFVSLVDHEWDRFRVGLVGT